MSVETYAKRASNYEWRKHLRPYGKRDANGAVRRMDSRIIAEFGDPTPRQPWQMDDKDWTQMWCKECHDPYVCPEASAGRAYMAGRYWLCPGCRAAWKRVVVPA